MRGVLILLVLNRFADADSFLHTKIEDDAETEISDWSEAKTDYIIRTIRFLVTVDSSFIRFYNYEEEKIKGALVTLINTVNQYFYPLNIRLAIIDILPVKGTNMGLDDFKDWKNEQKNLMDNDVIVLLRHNYEGGIAYQNGICTNNNMIISGFFPESTMNNAWVLIHQLAHVFGLTHEISTKCSCKDTSFEKCLKLRGFPRCSVQGMVEKLEKHTCLSKITAKEDDKIELFSSSLPICGNGLVEKGEECDCGPVRFCDNILCDATRCKFIFKKSWLSFSITITMSIIAFLALLIIWKCIFMRIWDSVKVKFSNSTTQESLESQRQNLNDETSLNQSETVVKMRSVRNVDVEAAPTERRRTRFSDIYISMRPISRFWEKFRAQAKENGDAAPI